MRLAIPGALIAAAAIVLGLALLAYRLARRRPRRATVWAHPLLGILAVGVLYAAVLSWRGLRILPLDAGALVLTFALLGGGLLFALRVTRLPRPLFVILVHGAAALLGGALVLVGLLRG